MKPRFFRTGLLGPFVAAVAIVSGASPAGACVDDYQPTRLAGRDRIDTAIEISQEGHPTGGAIAAVLARADAFPDALAGAPLAIAEDGPLLLTGSASLDPRVEEELRRAVLPGGTIFVLGGTNALSPAVESSLRSAGFVSRRLAGTDRYETAVAVARALGNPTTVLLATGRNFPDAVVAGAAAGQHSAAVLFTDDRRMPAPTADYLRGTTTVYGIGDQAATAAPDAIPLRGANRYDTAVLVARTFFGDENLPRQMGVATGTNFPDALAGSALVTKDGGGPLLLTLPDTLPHPVAQYIADYVVPVEEIYIYGDTGVVGKPVADQIERILYSCGP
jgi:hypothetical protein